MYMHRYFNRWKERNQIHFAFEGGGKDHDSGGKQGQGLGKKRIKLAADTAANVVHEQAFVRVHPYQKSQIEAEPETGIVDAKIAEGMEVNEPSMSSTTAGNTSKRSLEDLMNGDAAVSGSGNYNSKPAAGGESVTMSGLRRRRITLHIPLYYSCRMQKSLSAEKIAYFFPLVEHMAPAAASAAADEANKSHLQPIPPTLALIVGDNAVPTVPRWMCCIKNTNH
jgi:hypothetical protein